MILRMKVSLQWIALVKSNLVCICYRQLYRGLWFNIWKILNILIYKNIFVNIIVPTHVHETVVKKVCKFKTMLNRSPLEHTIKTQ